MHRDIRCPLFWVAQQLCFLLYGISIGVPGALTHFQGFLDLLDIEQNAD